MLTTQLELQWESIEHINKIISNQDTEIQDSQKYSIIVETRG